MKIRSGSGVVGHPRKSSIVRGAVTRHYPAYSDVLRVGRFESGLPLLEGWRTVNLGGGYWESCIDEDGAMARVRWSKPDSRGRYLWVAHYPGTRWGCHAAERTAESFNRLGRVPWEWSAYKPKEYKMIIKPHSYEHEPGVSLSLIPETSVEHALLRSLWKHGRLSSCYPDVENKFGGGFLITAQAEKVAE